MTERARRAAALAVGLAALALPAVGRAWCATTTSRATAPGDCAEMMGVPLRWASLCAGYSLYLAGSPELSLDDVRAVAQDAAGRWHMAVCDMATGETPYFELQPIADTWAPTGYNPHDTNANTVSFNGVWRNDAAHRPGSIAITIVTFDTATGEILDADVEMNQRSDGNADGFSFSTGMTQPGFADLPTILTHEFGHFHGIAHSMLETAVMWFEAGLGQARRDLTADDVSAICATYPETRHPAAPRVCNPTPFGGLSVTADGSKILGGCAVSAASPAAHAAPGRTAGRGALAGVFVVATAGWIGRRTRSRRRPR